MFLRIEPDPESEVFPRIWIRPIVKVIGRIKQVIRQRNVDPLEVIILTIIKQISAQTLRLGQCRIRIDF